MSAENTDKQSAPQHVSLVGTSWPEDLRDTYFAEAFIDVDQWQDGPVRHRCIGGGWRSNDRRFSFHFPSQGAYDDRFFQHASPAANSGNQAQEKVGKDNMISMSVANGAYFVETISAVAGASNDGSGPSVESLCANAASARLSRLVAQAVFGDKQRPHGFLFGDSDSAYQSMGAYPITRDVWDGFIPHVLGTPMVAPKLYVRRDLL